MVPCADVEFEVDSGMVHLQNQSSHQVHFVKELSGIPSEWDLHFPHHYNFFYTFFVEDLRLTS